MSWNSTFIAINRDFSNQLAELQADLGISLGEPVDTISWEDATSSMASGKSVGFSHGWTIICDPFMFLDGAESEPHNPNEVWLPTMEKGLESCSTRSKALGFILSGVSDTYGMTIYEDGKCVRRRLIQQGETFIDFGAPLPEEIEVFNEESDEEQRVFLMLEKFGLSYQVFESINFTAYIPKVTT